MIEIVLDTETTGLSVKDGHRIVEIGCVELVNRLPTKNIFHCYLNPERKISEDAFKIHGYSDEFLANKAKFIEIADKFLNFILLLVLVFLEPDGFYFHETYDPLLYFVFLLLINSQQFLLFVEKLNFKNLIILFSFGIIYYCTSVIKYLFFFVPQI